MHKNFCCKSLKYIARSYVDFVLKHVILRKVLRKNVWLACSHAREKKMSQVLSFNYASNTKWQREKLTDYFVSERGSVS